MQQDEKTEGKGNEENGKEGENGAEGENHLEKLICCRDGSIILTPRIRDSYYYYSSVTKNPG